MSKKKKQKSKTMNQDLRMMKILFIVLFFLLIGNMLYFLIFNSQKTIISAYNPRQDLLEGRIIRGQILSADRKVLAQSVLLDDGTYERIYPYKNIFSHAVGFSSRGKSGLESYANYYLLTSNAPIQERLYNEIIGNKNQGDTVVTTLDPKLQEVAYNALGKNKGAIVVMQPSTGKILAMVSKPDFNPNDIDINWSQIIKEDQEGATLLFNRATQGVYPPGSTYKIVTALQYIRNNPNWQDYRYTCTGKGTFYGNTISCYKQTAHGEVDLLKSFAVSCNTSFANIGLQFNLDEFKQLNEMLLFNKELPFDMPYKKSSFTLDENENKALVPETVIGQGKTEISPLHNGMITAAIANQGVLMKPYFIDSIENDDNRVIKKFMPEIGAKMMSEKEAKVLGELMHQVVISGTGSKLKNQKYTVAGKTGSADFKSGEKSHAVFVGFAPYESPEIVVSIIIENVGTSSDFAVPAAKKIFDAYFN